MRLDDGRRRVVIEGVRPEVDGGRFPAKAVEGEQRRVEADIFADGHDLITAVILHRSADQSEWQETPMQPLGNDRWMAEFPLPHPGSYCYTLLAWIDHFGSWQRDMKKRAAAGEDLEVQFIIGSNHVEHVLSGCQPKDRKRLEEVISTLRAAGDSEEKLALSLDEDLTLRMSRNADRSLATRYEKKLVIQVERTRAGFSAWYEMFPRSASAEAGRHGTFRDVEVRLPYIAEMGFDVLYLPPIHPIGISHRKGRNNAVTAAVGEPGSPWAIGSSLGGHTSIHPELGTLEDFRSLIARAGELGLELAMDIAFQASPDHPAVREHPEWFLTRPDGTVQYAENPPKKYQDIYPFNFDSSSWRSLWEYLRDIFLYWAEQGVRIFRVDNPHTKPLPFWEWVIAEVRSVYPDSIFLAEAFTRPRIMYNLAKAGFNQSYTYFAWRTSKVELTEYFTELTTTDVKDFFRPNVWPNTPDILTEQLQHGGRAAFMSRLVLSGTMSSNYGIYGPAFELGEHQPASPGSEEYLHSEKYEIRNWDLERPDSLRDFIGRVNRIRRECPALHSNQSLRFHSISNEQLICYSKATADFSSVILCVVNLDPYSSQSGLLDLSLADLGIENDATFQAHDLLTGARYTWHGGRQQITINPHGSPAMIFQIRRRVRTEHDFEYYL